jgi:integrase
MATPKRTDTGRWWIQIEIAGRRESSTFDTKSQATIWAAQRSTELRQAKKPSTDRSKTLADALARYAREVSPSKKGARAEQVRLASFAGPGHAALPITRKIDSITPEDLGAWRDSRLAKVKPGSVLREMTALATVFEAARREWRWLDTNPMRDVRRPAQPKHREKTLTHTEIRAMLRALKWRSTGAPATISQAIGRAFVFALKNGMRAGEICALEWSDLQTHSIKIRDGKTGARMVPLTPAARRTVESMRGFDRERIFGVDSESLDVLFRRARAKAGLSGFVFHDSRHTAATRMAQKLHVLELCKVFGWTSTTRALTYYNPDAEDLARRMAG